MNVPAVCLSLTTVTSMFELAILLRNGHTALLYRDQVTRLCR